MSILSNQTERDMEKHPEKQMPEEGIHYDCFHGIKHVSDTSECKVCPFASRCSWHTEMEFRGTL